MRALRRTLQRDDLGGIPPHHAKPLEIIQGIKTRADEVLEAQWMASHYTDACSRRNESERKGWLKRLESAGYSLDGKLNSSFLVGPLSPVIAASSSSVGL